MKILLSLGPLLMILSACGPLPLPKPNPGQSGGAPKVGFHTHATREGGYELHISVNGADHPVQEDVARFDQVAPTGYATHSIPGHAVAAGTFLELGDSEEDGQGVYATIAGRNVIVFSGYYEPGSPAVSWKRRLTIPF